MQSIPLCTGRWLFVRPALYCISDSANGDPVGLFREVVHCAIELFQFRHKDLPWGERLRTGKSLAAVDRGQTRLLVSRSVELAQTIGADGVHFPSGTLPTNPRQTGLGEMLAGVTVHSLEEALRAAKSPIDYLLVAPVFAPISKPATSEPLGLEKLRLVCSAVRAPVIALGGMTRERFAEVLDAGAAGIAGISLFAGAERVESAVEDFRRITSRAAQ